MWLASQVRSAMTSLFENEIGCAPISLRDIANFGSSNMIPIVKWHTDRSHPVWLC
jgi:hypothetical protein